MNVSIVKEKGEISNAPKLNYSKKGRRNEQS
jgi:hypothetical protein